MLDSKRAPSSFFLYNKETMSNKITSDQVKHIAGLANIPVTDQESGALAEAFEDTLAVVGQLQSVSVEGVEPTHQVTGFENVLREDVVEEDRMFSQEEALANAKNTHDGFFVVERIIDES